MICLIALLVSFYLAVVLIPPLCKLAKRISLVDVPNDRKIHEVQTPRIGGVGIIVASLFTFFLYMWVAQLSVTYQFKAYLAGVLILFITGILDDFLNLSYKKKLLGQCIAVAVSLFIGKSYIVNIGIWTISGEIFLPHWIAVPLTFLFIVGITNAFNLSDGLDGLAGGLSIFVFSSLAIISVQVGRIELLIASLAIIGALLAFLRYNSHPAIVFMGDTGSLFLGFTAAFISIGLTQSKYTAFSKTLPLLILGLPIMDTIFVFFVRLVKGQSPFSPDRKHFHYQFLTLGFTHEYAVLWAYFLQAIMFYLSIKLRYHSEPWIIFAYTSIFSYILLSFYFAKRSNRNFTGGQSMLISFSQFVDKPFSLILKKISINYIKVVLSLGIIWLSISAPLVNMTIVTIVFIFGLLTVLALSINNSILNYSFRLTVYLLISLLLFSSQKISVFQLPFSQQSFHHIFWGGIAVAVGIFHIVTRFESLRDTTLDYIILLMVICLPFLPPELIGRWHLGTIAGGMLVFIWSSELLIRNQTQRINFFNVSCLISVLLIFIRVII